VKRKKLNKASLFVGDGNRNEIVGCKWLPGEKKAKCLSGIKDEGGTVLVPGLWTSNKNYLKEFDMNFWAYRKLE
jgi:hypothetical protein